MRGFVFGDFGRHFERSQENVFQGVKATGRHALLDQGF